MIPVFRKELADLRRQEIELAAERSVATKSTRGARRSGFAWAIATVLRRVADRLEGTSAVEPPRDQALLRQP